MRSGDRTLIRLECRDCGPRAIRPVVGVIVVTAGGRTKHQGSGALGEIHKIAVNLGLFAPREKACISLQLVYGGNPP